MSKNDEYRANAAECERMARVTRNEFEKRTWHEMAESWLAADSALRDAGIWVIRSDQPRARRGRRREVRALKRGSLGSKPAHLR